MSSNIEEAVVERLRVLSVEQQQQVLKFVEQLEQQSASGATANDNSLPIWEVIENRNREAPPGTWDDVPTDGSINVDHYLYGAPKKQS